jgi:Rhodanese-like domain
MAGPPCGVGLGSWAPDVRRRLVPLLAAAILLGAAQPATPPDHPVAFTSVDELKTLMDRGTTVDVIDVRTRPEYDEVHIKGARSIPLREVADRKGEIAKNHPVVFY